MATQVAATGTDEMLLVGDVARAIKRSRSYAKFLILTGRIPSTKTRGGVYLVRSRDVSEYLKSR